MDPFADNIAVCRRQTMKISSHEMKIYGQGVLVTFILSGFDWLTGHDFNFFVFYFLPVFFAAWHLGSPGAVFFAILSAMVWYAADVLAGHTYQSDFYAVWNTMIHLVSFLVIGWSISLLKRTLDSERAGEGEFTQGYGGLPCSSTLPGNPSFRGKIFRHRKL
ncbi:MAG: hypothetical protein RQ753_05215 [Desulfurivibrionaceae bacterium]|nr:hypothetical protein [Desulfobulbales bacterium]MDT8335075.1 hypothetical protein [Desulfurivibrionaceae bacterium]